MFELLKVRKGTKESEPMTLQLAYATSRLAFDFLTGQEVRGLVWTASPLDPNVGSVHYDLDPSYPHECVAIKISNEMTKQLQAFGPDLDEELSFVVAPRVELATRSKEGDLTIGPMSQVHLNCAPTCVMEVGVSHEDEAELELEGDEWMQRAEVQAVILFKVRHEASPDDDCPQMSFRLGTQQDQGLAAWTEWQAFGRGTECDTQGLQDYTVEISWRHIVHGSALVSSFGHHAFNLDLYKIRRAICSYYQGTRELEQSGGDSSKGGSRTGVSSATAAPAVTQANAKRQRRL